MPHQMLVVDDNALNRDLLSRRLTQQGHLVSVATIGAEALGKMRGQTFDLILLDIMMPEMNGYQVLEAMKSDDVLRHIPVIVISAVDEIEVEIFEELSLRHDLQKIKTVGDAFMTTGGLLKPVENPVLNCVHCGLEMVAAATAMPPQWQVRVGIHIGPVMAGVVGHRQYLFDVLGDTVNAATRIESEGTPNAVNVSAEAWVLVSHLCQSESHGRVTIKGKGEMEIYQITNVL